MLEEKGNKDINTGFSILLLLFLYFFVSSFFVTIWGQEKVRRRYTGTDYRQWFTVFNMNPVYIDVPSISLS